MPDTNNDVAASSKLNELRKLIEKTSANTREIQQMLQRLYSPCEEPEAEGLADEEEDVDEDCPPVDHKAEVTVLEMSKNTRTGDLTITVLIQDPLNLEKPVTVDLSLTPDKGGRLRGFMLSPEDVERCYDIKTN